jgi:hypothetical protein
VMENTKRTTADTAAPAERAATAAAETAHRECYLSLSEAAAYLNVLGGLAPLLVEIQHERRACEWLRS